MDQEEDIEILEDGALYEQLRTKGIQTQHGVDGSLTILAPLSQMKNKVVKITLSAEEFQVLVRLPETKRAIKIGQLLDKVETKVMELEGTTGLGINVAVPKRWSPRTKIERELSSQIEKSRLSGDALVLGHSWAVGITDYGKPKDLERRFGELGVEVKIDSVCAVGAHFSEIEFAISRMTEKRSGKYQFVVIMIGGNDLGLEPKKVIERLEAQYLAARTLSDHVFISNIHITRTNGKKAREVNRLLAQSKIIPNKYIIDIGAVIEDYAKRDPRYYNTHPPNYGPVKDAIVNHITAFLKRTKPGIKRGDAAMPATH